jgi:UDP-3-O-[3-hydroxymyristoyl] glucosamine N-acyltransferase
MQPYYCLGDIASYLNAELRGNSDVLVTGLATLSNAGPEQLAFLSNPKYETQLEHCRAAAVLLNQTQANKHRGNCLIVDDPYLGYAKISRWFDNTPPPDLQVHSSAFIHPTAVVSTDVAIGPNVFVGPNVEIASGCEINANSSIGGRSKLGKNCRVAANVSIYHDVTLGDRVTVHSGSVIGADGFGFAPNGSDGWQKIHQLGGVEVGDDVEIGACSTIDRGAINNTIIGNGVIIDNHVQIAHNVVVGDHTAIVAHSAIAGSSKVGSHCALGGGVGVVGHITICDNVQLTARTMVTKDIKQPGSYSLSSTPLMPTRQWRKNSVRIAQLNDMALRLKKLENELE